MHTPDDDRTLERRLRAERPEPRHGFLEAMEATISSRPRRQLRRTRLAVVCAVSAALIATVGALGGFGYAASAISDAADGLTDTLTGAGTGGESGDSNISGAPTPAADQYGNPIPAATAAPTLTTNEPAAIDCVDGKGTITVNIFVTQPSHLEVTMPGVPLSGTISADVSAGTVTITIALSSCQVPADTSIVITASNPFGTFELAIPVES